MGGTPWVNLHCKTYGMAGVGLGQLTQTRGTQAVGLKNGRVDVRAGAGAPAQTL